MSMRWLAAFGFVLVGSLLSVRAADDKDISFKESGQYIGGINRYWQATLGGPKDRKWEYSFTHGPKDAFPNGDIQSAGTYEFVGDLVVFTGKHNGKAIRFGLNFGFPEGKVAFNGFFPADGQSLRYHRQWFRQRDGQWEVAEEITLTMPRGVPEGDQWQVAVKGEHVRREAGQDKRTAIDEKLTYTRTEGSPLYRLHRPKARFPFSLFPHVKDKQLEAAVQTIGPHSPFGFLRGFSPSLASLTEQE